MSESPSTKSATAATQAVVDYTKGLNTTALRIRQIRHEAAKLLRSGEQQAAFDMLAGLHERFGGSTNMEVRREVIAAAADRAALVAEDAAHAESFAARCKLAVDQAVELLDGNSSSQVDPLSRQQAARALDQWSRVVLHRSDTSPVDKLGDGRQGQSETSRQVSREVAEADQPYIEAVWAVVNRFADDTWPGTRLVVSRALGYLGNFHRQRLQLDEAIKVYELLDRKYGNDSLGHVLGELVSPIHDDARACLHEWASGCLNLGYIHYILLTDHAAALKVYRRLVDRLAQVGKVDFLSGARDANLEETLAMATASLHSCLSNLERSGQQVDWGLGAGKTATVEQRDSLLDQVNHCVDLQNAGNHLDALLQLDDVTARNTEATHPMLRTFCADAYARKTFSEKAAGENEAVVRTACQAWEQYRFDLSITVQKDLATILARAAGAADAQEHHDDELEIYDTIIGKWTGYTRQDILRQHVASAHRSRGILLENQDRQEEAEAAYRASAVGFFDENAKVRQEGADAMLNLGVMYWKQDRNREALHTLSLLDRKLDGATEDQSRATLWLARACMARCHRELGNSDEAHSRYHALLRNPDHVFAERPKMAANLRNEYGELIRSASLFTRLRWWWQRLRQH